jgi:protein-tyrosine phosphatase
MGGVVRRPPLGTRAVLNLCERADNYGAEYFVWQPIRDAELAPSIDWLRRMVQWVDAQRQAGRSTYVHCRNGVSRSGFVVVAYLMFKNGWNREQGLSFVRRQRALTRPNPAFMERLKEWERIVVGRAEKSTRS